MNITMATYSFSGYGLNINTFEITKETEKCYFTKSKYKYSEYRFLKDELGQIQHMTSNHCQYLKIAMVDATGEELKEKLAQWFENKANQMRKTK